LGFAGREYRLPVVRVVRRRSAPALLALFVVLALSLGGVSQATPENPTATLKLDGKPIRPELARTSAQRSVGLMNRAIAPADGMLFVFPTDTTGGFWMKNTLVPLKIVFFSAKGKRVRTLRMTPCTEEPCKIYSPRRRYRFALELPATDTRPAKQLGPLVKLRRLARSAT
jgi:uncharacterized membrane protein (UPF0127 family)